MSTKIKSEREYKFSLFFKGMFSNSESENKSDLDKEIKKIRESEDKEHMSSLLHLVEAPVFKKANFGGAKNLKAKFQNKEGIKREETERQEENDKSLDDR